MSAQTLERPLTATLDDRPAPVAVDGSDSRLLRRGVAVVGLIGIALVHVIDATGKFHETPYLGWSYVGLIVVSLLVAGALVERDDRRAWIGAVVVSVAAFVGYALSRTTGLPSATDDIGNWFEPLGLVTMFAEALVAAVGVRALSAGRRH